MSGWLIAANVAGCILVCLATLKRLDSAEVVSALDRLVMLGLVFLALVAAIDTLSSRSVPSPAQAFLIFVWGLFSSWRAFGPEGKSVLQAVNHWIDRRRAQRQFPPAA